MMKDSLVVLPGGVPCIELVAELPEVYGLDGSSRLDRLVYLKGVLDLEIQAERHAWSIKARNWGKKESA